MVLKSITQSLIFCGGQGIALRGHRDSGRIEAQESNENEGNFRELLEFRLRSGDLELGQHLQNCSANAK